MDEIDKANGQNNQLESEKQMVENEIEAYKEFIKKLAEELIQLDMDLNQEENNKIQLERKIEQDSKQISLVQGEKN